MNDSVDDALSSIIELLRECGLDSQADWFNVRRDVLRESPTESDEFAGAIRELQHATAGMGGFTDIPLTPRSDLITVQDARDKQWELADALGDAIEELSSQ